jgi:hypothetical protein
VTSATKAEQAGGLELKPVEREVLAEEVLPFAATLKDPDARERYVDLGRSIEAGSVPRPLVPALEAMLELILQTRRLRQRHGPDAEQALTDLFYRTERGSGLREAAREVNTALEALRGHTIEKLSVTAAPGRHNRGDRHRPLSSHAQAGSGRRPDRERRSRRVRLISATDGGAVLDSLVLP